MGKKRCAGCGQFAGFAHRCPAVNAGSSRSLVDTLLGRQTPAFQAPQVATGLPDPWDTPDSSYSLPKYTDPQSNFDAAVAKYEADRNEYLNLKDLRYAARKLAVDPAGQKTVLESALKAAENNDIRLASSLIDELEYANEDAIKKDPSANEWSLKTLGSMGEQSTYDKLDTEIRAMRETLQTPLVVPPAGHEPSKTYPFSGKKAAEHVNVIAYHVRSDETDIYPKELKEEAREYERVSFVLEEPGHPGYADQRYVRFANKVWDIHRKDKQVTIARLKKYLNGIERVERSRKTRSAGLPWDDFNESKPAGYSPNGWLSDPL